jgi:hypothetical protein
MRSRLRGLFSEAATESSLPPRSETTGRVVANALPVPAPHSAVTAVTIDGFVTLLALVVAVVAVIPSAMRRALDLKFDAWDRFIVIISFIAVIVLEYYETVKVIFHIPSFGFAQKYHLTPPYLAFLVVLLSGFFVAAVVFLKPIPARRMEKLRRLIETLLEDEQFGEAVEILSPYIEMIANIHSDPSRQQSHRQPRTGQNVAASSSIFRLLFLSPKVAQYIARSKPYVAIDMLKQNSREVSDFLAMYINALMGDRYSILYFEARQNQNFAASGGGYEFPSANRLLYFLFGDAKNAERLDVWVPIGDFLMTGPASPQIEENRIFLNREMREFQRNEQWSHPWFVGIFLYDLMVTAALHQNVSWHMGLYDFSDLTELLLVAHNGNAPNIDPDAEFPTIGHYLIYEMFSAMHRWIQDARNLPVQENIKLKNHKFDHENGNIPKSAIMTMIMCLKSVILADNISDKFKRYLLSILLSTYENTLFKNTTLYSLGYSEMMLNAIKVGDFWKDPGVPIYRHRLLQLLPKIDLALKPEARAVRDALRESVAEDDGLLP